MIIYSDIMYVSRLSYDYLLAIYQQTRKKSFSICIKRKDRNFDKLMKYAKNLRIATILNQYLLVMQWIIV